MLMFQAWLEQQKTHTEVESEFSAETRANSEHKQCRIRAAKRDVISHSIISHLLFVWAPDN